MAEGGSVTEDRNNCSICLEYFKRPKLLPCHHSFCAACLEEYIDNTKKNGEFQCPLCRKTTKVPPTGVEEFQTNFYILPESEEANQIIPCDVCGAKNPADHRCLDCDENFCTQCTKAHMAMKMSRTHKMMELNIHDLHTQKIKSRVFCQKHQNQEILIFCKDCNELLCLLCTLTEHKIHNYREVSEEAKERRDGLRKVAAERTDLADQMKGVERRIEQLKSSNQDLFDDAELDVRGIREQTAQLHSIVDTVAKELEDKLLQSCNKITTDNKTEINELEKEKQNYDDLVHRAELAVGNENDVEIIKTFHSIMTQNEIQVDRISLISKEFAKKIPVKVNLKIGTSDRAAIGKLMGKVSISVKGRGYKGSAPLSLLLVHECLLDTPDVFGIAPHGGHSAWVSFFDQRKLFKVDCHGTVKLSIDVGTSVGSVSDDGEGGCFVSCVLKKRVKKVTLTGEVVDLNITLDSHPHGMCYENILGQKQLLIACAKCTNPYACSGNGSIVCASVDGTGKWSVLRSFNFGVAHVAVKDGSDLIAYSSCGGCQITVSNRDSWATVESRTLCNPFGFCFDIGDCLIFADGASNLQRLCLTDPKSETFLTQLKNKPFLASNGECVWIGGDTGEMSVYEKKYAVQ